MKDIGFSVTGELSWNSQINKAAGLDLILNKFIMYGKNQLLPLLLRLFNVMFLKGYFPESWSEGFILPLHNKRSVDSVEITEE